LQTARYSLQIQTDFAEKSFIVRIDDRRDQRPSLVKEGAEKNSVCKEIVHTRQNERKFKISVNPIAFFHARLKGFRV
jgi:hypothetical protein